MRAFDFSDAGDWLAWVQATDDNEGETTLPTGWVQGHMLTIYSPEQLGFSGELQTITGTIETWERFEAAIVDAEGVSYRFDLGSYYSFQGLPVDPLRPFPNTLPLLETMQSGQSVTLTGRQTIDGHFYLLWGEAVALEDEMLVLYRPFFDLYRFDPLILSQYPMAATLYLRGPWAQVRAFLIDEPNNALPDSILTLDADQDVIIKGRLESTDPPRLALNEFYYLDGECELMMSDVQQCKYYQPVEIEN
ncbi:hypothetical protein MNBD_CHLOROFLEXI01-1112 [hydrothermal vent metagenome]|uniref:Uncharacterized protein n=1 Tax=hydrothermal vent metagenome TaxID=652676 RepID=A0A3B0V2R1_9ZZZZ